MLGVESKREIERNMGGERRSLFKEERREKEGSVRGRNGGESQILCFAVKQFDVWADVQKTVFERVLNPQPIAVWISAVCV